MASTHKSLRSGTANKRPTTSIADGQIALNTNTTSPGLFFKDSTGATIIKVGPVHVGTTAPNASPAAGGSAGNSIGEIWLDTSLTPVGVKIWNGSAFVNATPIGSTTVQGLLELATSAETQAGSDTDRAVTPAGLQSKVSDSTSTTSSTTIASSTAVKSAYDLANAALPKSGGTVTGNLEIGTTGSLSFEGATADAFETTIAVVDPTADRTITLPDTTGTIVTTGDTGTVTSTMIADGTIVNGDINASAAIAGTKISPDFGSQTIATTGIVSHALGTAAAPTVTFTGDTNTGIYSPGADQVAISTNGSGRLFINSSGNVGLGTSSPNASGFGSTVATINIAAGSNGGLELTKNNVAAGHFTVESNANNDIRVGAVGASAALTFQTAGSERLRITSAGLVGIGTSSPSSLLHLATGAGVSSELRFSNSANNWSIKTGTSANSFSIVENQFGGTPLFIDSSLRVGIGNNAPGALLDLGSATVTQGYIKLRSTGSGAREANIYSPATGGLTIDTNSYAFPVVIQADSVQFGTGASGTERARIDSSGRLLVGTSTPLANTYVASFSSALGGGIWAQATGAGDSCYASLSPGNTVGMHYAGLNSAGTVVYRVNQNGDVRNTNNSYGAISDIKLKENIVDASSQWNDVKSLRVRKYNFKENEAHTQIGLIAQEVESISPGLVSESRDFDLDGNDLGTVTKSVNYSVLYMKAVKALQEAMERIEQLESEMAAVKAQLA